MARKKGKCFYNPANKTWMKRTKTGFKKCTASDLKGTSTSGLGHTKGMVCKRFKRVPVVGYNARRCAEYEKKRTRKK